MSDQPRHPLPDPEFSGQNLSEIPGLFECDGYSVMEWTPGRDGRGKAEAVCVQFDARIPGVDGDPDLTLAFFARLKSAKEVNRLIAMLRRHRDSVWPETVICASCGNPRHRHPYRHPFRPVSEA